MTRRRLLHLAKKITKCRKCPRLVEYRRAVAEKPPKRYLREKYWAKPLPGFGDPYARIIVVGLAPAAHGGNRTGRMFTGNHSGNTLMNALYSLQLSNKPVSTHRNDGLTLRNVYLTAAARCPPPKNKPLPKELENCLPYLEEEFSILPNIRVAVALGSIALNTVIKLLERNGVNVGRPKPKFRHGVILKFSGKIFGKNVPTVLASYHPSRQNTQTGRLSIEMLVEVFRRALEEAEAST